MIKKIFPFIIFTLKLLIQKIFKFYLLSFLHQTLIKLNSFNILYFFKFKQIFAVFFINQFLFLLLRKHIITIEILISAI